MRREDLKKLEEPYSDEKIEMDRRFHRAIGADVSSANELVREIWNDLDPVGYGVEWWTIPDDEKILIGDYLYQCASAIEINLVEARLHFLEWLHARDKENDRIADMVQFDYTDKPEIKAPAKIAPIHELPSVLEDLHICGFFRAFGSAMDCLGAVIIGVLALETGLRRSDIGIAERALRDARAPFQTEFCDFYAKTKLSVGVSDWFEWANQYRNMLIHRGRLITHRQLVQRENPLLDSRGRTIIRTNATTHLSRFPNKSDVETWLKAPPTVLNEDAEKTLEGIFRSCRDFHQIICERLIDVWRMRRVNPGLVEQPISQWKNPVVETSFVGYAANSEQVRGDLGLMSPILSRRLRAAAADDQHRTRWSGSKWA